jgi:spermidine synthase
MTNFSDVEIRIITSADTAAVVRLYKSAGWWEDHYVAEAFIPGMVKHSTCFAGAFAGGGMIGMGRAVSDNVSDAYIQDIVVLDEYRRRGIGGEIVKVLIRELKAKGIDWIGLIGEPGTEKFYERLGFETLKGFVPMKLRA